jgi:glutathione-specific gamma-glutamylcyclotransferase
LLASYPAPLRLWLERGNVPVTNFRDGARSARVQPVTEVLKPRRDAAAMLERAIAEWGGREDLWIFGYGSLIWRPDFDFIERRAARVHGWHRALKMWSRINRGTPERPGLVFGLLTGGCCRGMVFRVNKDHGADILTRLWSREMATAVYDPKWVLAETDAGRVRALAFTLSRKSPSHTGELTEEEYRAIFAFASGIYGTTLDYAHRTLEELRRHDIRDRNLEKLLRLIEADREQA